MDIVNDNLKTLEKKWLNKVLSVDFPYREEVVKQINSADVLRDYSDYHISLKFTVPASETKIPLGVRVPVEMRVFQQGHAPIQFLLHIIHGKVSELEAFSADSSKMGDGIKLENVKIENIVYSE